MDVWSISNLIIDNSNSKKVYFEVETAPPGCLKVILVAGEEMKEEALAGS